MKHDRIRLETHDTVTVMTLNDPSVLNAFGYYLKQDMTEALDIIETSGTRSAKKSQLSSERCNCSM